MNMYTFLYNINSDALFIVHYHLYIKNISLTFLPDVTSCTLRPTDFDYIKKY